MQGLHTQISSLKEKIVTLTDSIDVIHRQHLEEIQNLHVLLNEKNAKLDRYEMDQHDLLHQVKKLTLEVEDQV